MHWKTVGIPAGILFIAAFLAVKLFSPANNADLQTFFDLRMQAVENRLDQIEKKLAGTERSVSSSRSPDSSQAQKASRPLNNDALPSGKTKEKPADVGLSLSPQRAPGELRAEKPPLNPFIGNGPSPPVGDSTSGDQATPANPIPKGSMQALNSFFNGLSSDKHVQAETIFQSHFESLRLKMDDAKEQGLSPQELNSLIYDDQMLVREEMKGILSEKEYKAFIEAAPVLPKP